MFKIVTMAIISLMSMSLFTGCVQPDLHPNKNKGFWGDFSSADDVNMSDDNLTESEMMISEDDEENRLERIEFPVSEYTRLARTGKGTVRGKIYVTDAYDRPVVGENTRLYLNPLTSYSEQWYEESYLGGYKMQKADSRLFNYLKFTASDKNGKFAFYGVPSGSYYLIGTVKCGEECGYDSMKNIRIATKVTVRGNQVVKQDLTRMVE
ncbi:MAG: carboxypeptidase regulatory-like domain-containing protein [Epsilonproteobacteria bacterium]|nr:MAG: carboxypeptidase regulatory-like domain-containing protein [Campylobacterota bacterium]